MHSLLKPQPIKQAEKQIARARTYTEWAEAAQMHDEITGRKEWKKEERSRLYDYQIIRTRLQRLRRCRLNGDDKGLLFTLNEGIHGNMGGMGSVALYTVAKFGTKELINEYIDEIVSALLYLDQLDIPDITFEEKTRFFSAAPAIVLAVPR